MSKFDKNNELIITIIMVIPTLTLGFFCKAEKMGLYIIAATICVAFFNIDKIKSISSKIISLETNINKANDTLENIQKLATPLICSILHNVTHDGRTNSDKENIRIYEKLKKLVLQLKIESPEIKEYFLEYKRYFLWDILRVFYAKILKNSKIKDLENFKKYLNENLPKDNKKVDIGKSDILEMLGIEEGDLTPEEKDDLNIYLDVKKEDFFL